MNAHLVVCAGKDEKYVLSKMWSKTERRFRLLCALWTTGCRGSGNQFRWWECSNILHQEKTKASKPNISHNWDCATIVCGNGFHRREQLLLSNERRYGSCDCMYVHYGSVLADSGNNRTGADPETVYNNLAGSSQRKNHNKLNNSNLNGL